MHEEQEDNVVDFASSAAKLMGNKAMVFLMRNKNGKDRFMTTRLMKLNEGSIVASIARDKDSSSVHLNFKFKCVECNEKIKIQYTSVSPKEISSNWIQSICDTCHDELSLHGDEDD